LEFRIPEFANPKFGIRIGNQGLWKSLIIITTTIMSGGSIYIAKILGLFVVAGLAEIGGGWLVWEYMRDSKPYWYAIVGSCILILYGFIPTFQPINQFGRLYAVYGGIFIAMSFAWSAVFDGFVPDKGDIIGSGVALAGVLLILFWPRDSDKSTANNI
jgi:drug/metabolite transporter superfamily protein YnfA